MDVINDALEVAVMTKDKSDWTPVSVNVAPATLTILSKQVRRKAGENPVVSILPDLF